MKIPITQLFFFNMFYYTYIKPTYLTNTLL